MVKRDPFEIVSFSQHDPLSSFHLVLSHLSYEHLFLGNSIWFPTIYIRILVIIETTAQNFSAVVKALVLNAGDPGFDVDITRQLFPCNTPRAPRLR